MHASTLWRSQPETQPANSAAPIDSSQSQPVQREIPVLDAVPEPQWVDEAIVSAWRTYREAVSWCWENQRHFVGMRKGARQTLFANHAGLHAPHASRCLDADSRAPMELPTRCLSAFESFTGWRGVRQYLLRDAGLTAMEQVIAQRAGRAA